MNNTRTTITTLLALTIVLTAISFLSPGQYPSGIDTPAHLFKAATMEQMLETHGTIYHWSNDWYGGYPFLSLYSPVSYYLFLGIDIAAQDLTLSFNILRAVLLFLTAFMLYILAREGMDNTTMASAAGILGITAYPLYNNLYNVGRVPFATGIILFLACLALLFRDELYTTELNRYHVFLAAAAVALLYTHSMSMYFLLLTGLIFLAIHRSTVAQVKPAIIVLLIGSVTLLGLPYLIEFLRHATVTDPQWIKANLVFNPFSHIGRRFGDYAPHYLGLFHTGFLLIGLVTSAFRSSTFQRFCSLNFLLYFLLFWGEENGLLSLLPLANQFDLARFEIMFTLFGVMLAAYGLYELQKFIPDNYHLLLAAVVVVGIGVDIGPMTQNATNWSPQYQDPEPLIDNQYRVMSFGTRHWDTYLFPIEHDTPNVMGWFPQSNPHYNMTKIFQGTGGLWYPTDPDFPVRIDNQLRKNLMQLSNTKYIFVGKDWYPEQSHESILGFYDPDNPLNRWARQSINRDNEMIPLRNTSAASLFRLDREMSYCRPVTPVWVDTAYSEQAQQIVSSDTFLPRMPVTSSAKQHPSTTAAATECTKQDPYTIQLSSDRPAWVLVKESYYPFWHRDSDKQIYNGFGFMVTHVDGNATLQYTPARGTLVQ